MSFIYFVIYNTFSSLRTQTYINYELLAQLVSAISQISIFPLGNQV